MSPWTKWHFESTKDGSLWIDNGTYDGIVVGKDQFNELAEWLTTQHKNS